MLVLGALQRSSLWPMRTTEGRFPSPFWSVSRQSGRRSSQTKPAQLPLTVWTRPSGALIWRRAETSCVGGQQARKPAAPMGAVTRRTMQKC